MSSPLPLHRKRKGAARPRAEAAEQSAPLLGTRLVPPRAAPQRIVRTRLESLLAEASERLLTVIRAPGGFGKTTLALAWIEALRGRGDAVAWLSLDADDDEPRRFLHHLIRSVQLALAGTGAEPRRVSTNSPLDSLQAALVNQIADSGEDLFLFLDDYHSISQPAAHGIVAFLLRHAPANLRVVLLSRTDPQLGLAALRARGLLLEIDAAKLRFTREETGEFLRLAAIPGLTASDVRRVHGLTEGWPAALRITSLSFGAGRDPADMLRALAGSSRSIGGFLDELLGLQLPESLEFMERTAICDKLSPALCDAITGTADGQQRLEQLARQQMVDPLDAEGSVFACHQLLREHLLQRQERRRAAELPELHRRAAGWYEAHGMLAESVKHWLAAGDTQAALARIVDCADDLVQSGDVLTLLRWEQQLRAKLVPAPLELQLAVAWARALSLARDEALHGVTTVEHLLGDDPAPAAQRMRLECLAVRAVTAGLADDHARALEYGTRYASSPGSRAFALDAVNNTLRFACVKTARWAEFHALPPVPPPAAESRTGLLTAIYETVVRGVAEFSQGRAAAAEQQYLRCIALGARVREFSGAMTLAAGPYAELLYETDRTDAAAALLRGETDEWLGGTSVDTVLRASRTAARLAWRRGDFDSALDLLERAEAIGLTRDWPRLVSGVLLERLRLNLRTGRQASALGLLKRLEQAQPAHGTATVSAIADAPHYLCMARLLVGIEQNRPQAAIREAERLFGEAVGCGAHVLAIRIGSLLACAFVASRSIGPALRVFHRVVDLAEPGGLLGSIADAGPEVLTLVGHAEAEVVEGPDAARRREFLSRIRATAAQSWSEAGIGARRDHVLKSLLTPRECEILELIAEGRSNKAIARELNLGPETVKSHLKHVFAKLGVERRTQAVLRAGELGLVKSRARL